MYKTYIKAVLITLFIGNFIEGQSIKDLQKMKKEFEDLKRKNIGTTNAQDDLNELNEVNFSRLYNSSPYKISDGDLDSIKQSTNFFGYNFFTKRDTLPFWENLPAPANYYIGPGDEIIVSLWGQTQLRETYLISRDGKIYDEKIGLLNVSGKTVKESRKYLLNQFSRIYATLKGRNPSTYMDVSLGKLKSINVNFVGDVLYPGVHPVHPFSTVITGLIQAGGIDTIGSLRSIEIKRKGAELSNIDLYDYLIKGKITKNIQLRDQDLIVVPTRKSSIKIDSAVIRPGVYESIPGETLKEMLGYAGGLKATSSSTISIQRITPLEKRLINTPNFRNYYVDYKNSEINLIQDGDIIKVLSISKVIEKVEIIGQVKNPGIYSFVENMRVKDLIDIAGGFNDTTFWKSVYQKKSEIVRRNPETRYATVIDIDLKKIMDGDLSENIKLSNLDRFVVHANRNFFEKENIIISGEVEIPGSYPLIYDNETLRSVLDRSGGMTKRALRAGVSIFRDKKYFETQTLKNVVDDNILSKQNDNIDNSKSEKIRVAWKNESINLMPGDSIVVKQSTGTINVIGQIYNPGLIEFRKNKPLRYYINNAGGLSQNANKNGIIVIYANGLVGPKKWYSNPKIEDGSTIIVNKKDIREPFDLTQFATNWSSIISSLITAIVLSQQVAP